MAIVSTALRSLFPRGSPWRLLGNLGNLIEGLADTLERVHAFARATLAESLPGTATAMLPEWHRALGRNYDATMTVAFQRRMLAAVWTALGSTTLAALQAQIQKELTGVIVQEILTAGPTSECGLAECGGDECNSTITGVDINPYQYSLSGTVQDDAEAERLASILSHFAPLHLIAQSTLIILSQNATSEAGLDQCGIAECNA